jgi:hypothetical protein
VWVSASFSFSCSTFSLSALCFSHNFRYLACKLSFSHFKSACTASSSSILSAYEFTTPSSSTILPNCTNSLALASRRFTNSASACERVINLRKSINMKIQRQHKTYTPQTTFQVFIQTLQWQIQRGWKSGSTCKAVIRAYRNKMKLKCKNSPDTRGGKTHASP